MSSQNSHSFLLALASEAISIDQLGLIAPKLHSYTSFILLKFIFHKKLPVEGEYRFFFDFDMSSQNSHFCLLALASEAISIDQLGLIAPKLHSYTSFISLKFIFHKKIPVEGEYRFFFRLVYYLVTIKVW